MILICFNLNFKMSQFDKSEIVSLAKICYKNDRHEDVIRYINEVIKMGTLEHPEERQMLFCSNLQLILPFANSITDDSDVEEKIRRNDL